MASFLSGELTKDGNDPVFEANYRAGLIKNGIRWEDAPMKNGTITLKDVSFWDKVKAATKAVLMAPIVLVTPVVGAATKIVTSAGETSEKLPGIAEKVPAIALVLAAGIAGYLIFAGRKGVNFSPFK